MAQNKRFYTSPQIQNELIKCTSNQVRNSILKKVMEAMYYALKQTKELSHLEHLSISKCFVDKDCQVNKAFIMFNEVPSMTTENIYNIIIKQLQDRDNPVQLCYEQCCDSCSYAIDTTLYQITYPNISMGEECGILNPCITLH